MVKRFMYHLPQKNIKKDYLFNMLGGIANSSVSVLLLILVSHVLGETEAGIFTLSYSTAQMLYMIAVFESRNLQVTDAKNEFCFNDFFSFRIITVAIMLFFAVVFVFVNGFSSTVVAAILLFSCFMAAVAFSDVMQGAFQKNGYLWVSGASLGAEMLLSIIGFSVTLILTRNILISIIPMIVIVLVWLFVFDLPFLNNFESIKPKFKKDKQCRLLLNTLPLFISVFINQYAINCPKYAIDKYLTELDQSRYGFLLLPAFFINLLSIFVFRPQLVPLSKLWSEQNFKAFHKKILNLFLCVLGFTVLTLLAAFVFGIPLLNLLFNTNLSGYRSHLLVLITAGAFSAGSSLCYIIIAITRKQHLALFAYIISALMALTLPYYLVSTIGFNGAPLAYLVQTVTLFVLLLVLVIFTSVFNKKSSSNF